MLYLFTRTNLFTLCWICLLGQTFLRYAVFVYKDKPFYVMLYLFTRTNLFTLCCICLLGQTFLRSQSTSSSFWLVYQKRNYTSTKRTLHQKPWIRVAGVWGWPESVFGGGGSTLALFTGKKHTTGWFSRTFTCQRKGQQQQQQQPSKSKVPTHHCMLTHTVDLLTYEHPNVQSVAEYYTKPHTRRTTPKTTLKQLTTSTVSALPFSSCSEPPCHYGDMFLATTSYKIEFYDNQIDNTNTTLVCMGLCPKTWCHQLFVHIWWEERSIESWLVPGSVVMW